MKTFMNDPAGFLASKHNSVEEVRRCLARNSENLVGVKDVLDVGCGPGDVTTTVLRPALQPDATIVGSDLSPQMIEFASNKFGNESISFRQMDVTANITSWRKESFDMIFSFYTLQRLQDQRKVSENLYYLLKPGGKILILIPLDDPCLKMFELVYESARFKQHRLVVEEWLQSVLRWKDPVQLCSTAISQAGFTDVTCQTVHNKTIYPTVDDFIGHFESIHGIKQDLPAAAQGTFVENCRRIVEEKKLFEQKASGIQYKGVLLEIVATKPI